MGTDGGSVLQVLCLTSPINRLRVFWASSLSSRYRGKGPAPNFLLGVTMCRPSCIHSTACAAQQDAWRVHLGLVFIE